ncbi:MAG: hypothetical protein IKM28_00135 [Lachnospiraceae bacterium]|nr:hypothetical protein [Lachnospiraceae bacterium]
MPRGQRKTLEEKIAEKEELIQAWQTRIKSEQNELEALYNEKKLKDLESLDEMVRTSGLNESEIAEALENYRKLKEQNVS